jgi:hypothetical protein
MLFGSRKDFDLLVNINRELLKDIVEQEILIYKLSASETTTNIYGEALEKTFLEPVKLNCLITRGDQIVDIDEFGPDLGREASFACLKQDLEDITLVPEVGDIVMWHEDYYEVDTVRENQYFYGRNDKYNVERASGHGASISLVLDCHLTRADRVGIARQKL